MVGNDANNGEGILKRFGEHISEEVNSMGENIGVLTNEYYLIFEHHQGPNIEKTLESKHAEDGINPLPSEECFTFVPVAHKGQLLLVY